jgi:hypothetical protein
MSFKCMHFIVGHPGMFQVKNYMITVDTTKYVFNGAICFYLFNRSSSG